MYPPALRPLLVNPAFVPNDIIAAEDICREWFANTSSLEAFVLRAVFLRLMAEDWHVQGVPNTDWQNFLNDVLPRMVAVLDALPGNTSTELRALVIGYHSTI
jgi:hypothetical protein